MWYCDEDDLGASNGPVTVDITSGITGWAVHAHLYTGVDQGGPTDYQIDNTSATQNEILPAAVDIPANGLLVFGAANGQSGSYNDADWDTNPTEGTDDGLSPEIEMTEVTDGPHPSSAILATAYWISSTGAQTNRLFRARGDVANNRGTGIVAVWGEASSGSGTYDQDSFRARNDNGNETTSTWTAAADTNWTQMVDKNFRVRFLVQETAGVADSGKTFQLEYNRNGGGWNDVTGSSSVIKAAATSNVTDGTDTTQQLGSGTYVSTNAGFDEADGQVGSMDFAGNDEVELEFSLQIVSADVSNGDTIQLRVKGLDTYTSTPTVTVTGSGTFSYKKSIEIQEAEVTCTSNVSNMPVMVQLTSTDFQEVEDDVDADGYDIIFKAEDDATCGGAGLAPCILDHEIELYDETNDKLVAWVRIPVLDFDNNTTIYLYYGNGAVTAATHNPTGVWDRGYMGVWHLSETPSDGVAGHLDSTSNNNAGTPQNFQDGGGGTTDAAGKIGGADSFAGDDDEVRFSDAIIGDSAAWTITAWMKMVDAADKRTIYSEGDTAAEKLLWVRIPQSGNTVGFWYANPAGNWICNLEGITPVDDNEFHYVAMVQRSKTDRELFVDNTVSMVSQGTNAQDPGTLTHNTASIGMLRAGYDADFFNGIIDEVRISNVARDSCWIETEHSNQNTPTSFYIVGSQTSTTPAAEYDQDSFRSRNDNGDETTSTWSAVANTNWTQMVDKNFRVRFLVQETAGVADSGKTFQLEYNRNGGGWNDVTGSSSVIKATATANVTDATDTTQQLGSGTFVSTNAGFDEADGQVGSMDFAGSDEVELELSLQIVSADVSNGDTIQLRVKGLDTYTSTPTVTVTGAGTFAYKKSLTIQSGQMGASCTSTTDTWQVSANNRDSWDDSSSGDINGCGFGDTNYYDAGGYQWAVDIPQGATITSAKVRVYSNSHTGGTGAYTARIRVEDVVNASAFTGAPNDIYNRTYYGTTVDWDIPAGGLPTGTWSESPDIAALVQHIVDNGSWIPGNYLSIAIWGQTAVTGGCIEDINDQSDNPTYAAQLEVTYDSGSGSIQDFPVMIQLTGTDFQQVEDDVDADYHDIIFKAEDDATCGGAGLAPCILDHEIELYDETNDKLVAWVRIPALDYNSNTTIYLYYGNAAVTAATENPTGVWDSTYKGVWHLHDNFLDSTGNLNTGTNYGSEDIAGKVANADHFTQSENDYVDFGHDTSLDLTSTGTLSAWVNFDSNPNTYALIVGKANGGNADTTSYGISKDGGSGRFFLWVSDDVDQDLAYTNTSSWTPGNWYHFVGVWSGVGSTMQMYVNGQPDGSPITQTNNAQIDSAQDIHIGCGFSSTCFADSALNGIVDEVRISNIVRDQCWIETEHSNQDTPASFYIVGSQQSTSNSPPTLTVNQPDGTGDTVTVGDSYDIYYDLADSDDVVTVAFYYDDDNTGENGTAITGACSSAAEGTGVYCTWDTTGMTPGSYYIYGITDDGTNPQVSAYSPGQITINAGTAIYRSVGTTAAPLASGGASITQAIKIQRNTADVPNTGTTQTAPSNFTAFSSLTSAFVLNKNNRFGSAGASALDATNRLVADLSLRIELTATDTITFTRLATGDAANYRADWESWEYVGAPGGPNEFIVRSRDTVTITGGNRTNTATLSNTPTDIDKCIPFITGISNTNTGSTSPGLTALAWISGTNTLNIERGGSTGDTVVQVVTVEFTGSNWRVGHGRTADFDGVTGDTGTVTLYADADGQTTPFTLNSVNNAIIASAQFKGDDADGNNAITDTYPAMYISSTTQVSWVFDAGHDGTDNQIFVHVLENGDMSVTRYTNTGSLAGDNDEDITTAGVTDLTNTAIFGTRESGGTGTAFPRGWTNYRLTSTTNAALWCTRSGNTIESRIEIAIMPMDTAGGTNELVISGSTATFGTALADNIGVGDVIQYDSDDNDSIDALAFIHGRTDSQTYTVKDKDGNVPTAVTSDYHWAIYRAYTSLDNCVNSQTENPNITEPVEDDVNPNKNLASANTFLNIACYADGDDTTAATITGWTTGADNYINIYTPTSTSEVGTTQRHSGVWDTNKYILSSNGSAAIYTDENTITDVRIDGLQIELTGGNGTHGIVFYDGIGSVNFHVSNNIIRDAAGASTGQRPIYVAWNWTGGETRIWNNIVYGFNDASDSGILIDNGNLPNYVYNNTVRDCNTGIRVVWGSTTVAKNNVVQDCGTGYSTGGGWDGSSTNNCSDDGTHPGGSGQTGEVTFLDELGSPPDLRLDPTDSVARENGADLHTEFFDDDIEGESRPGQSSWDTAIKRPTIRRSTTTMTAARPRTTHPRWVLPSRTQTPRSRSNIASR